MAIGARDERIAQAQRAGVRIDERGVRAAGGAQRPRGEIRRRGQLRKPADIAAGGIGRAVVIAQQHHVRDIARTGGKLLERGDDLEIPRPVLAVRKQRRLQHVVVPRQLRRRVAPHPFQLLLGGPLGQHGVAESAEALVGQLRRQREKGLAALAHVIAQAPVGIAVEQNLENQQHGQQQGQDGKKGTSQNTSRPENFVLEHVAQFFSHHCWVTSADSV